MLKFKSIPVEASKYRRWSWKGEKAGNKSSRGQKISTKINLQKVEFFGAMKFFFSMGRPESFKNRRSHTFWLFWVFWWFITAAAARIPFCWKTPALFWTQTMISHFLLDSRKSRRTTFYHRWSIAVSTPEANAIKVLQVCIYKSVKTCRLLKSRVATNNVIFNMFMFVFTF